MDPDVAQGRASMRWHCGVITDRSGWTLVAGASWGSVAALDADTSIGDVHGSAHPRVTSLTLAPTRPVALAVAAGA